MKHLVSTQEGVWKQVNQIELTEEQRTLLQNRSEEVAAQKQALKDTLMPQMHANPEPADLAIAENCYTTNKPTVDVDQEYQLIGVDVIIIDGIGSGIINCRVDGKHKQVRF